MTWVERSLNSPTVALLVTGALLLTACTATDRSGQPIATPQPSKAPTPTALPTPTAAPTAVIEDRPDTLRPRIDDLLALPVPLNIARAGGDLLSPSSTLFAMSRAVQEGAVMLELDVRLTADGVLVVHGDESLADTTEATGLVSDLTLDELQALDHAFWFAENCSLCPNLADEEYIYRGVRTAQVPAPAGYVAEDFRIPTLEEVIERFPTVSFDIEVDSEFPAAFAVVQSLARTIDEFELTDHVVVVSRDDSVLEAFAIFAPDVETSPGEAELSAWLFSGGTLAPGHRIIQVPPTFEGVQILNAAFWQNTEEEGLAVWVWMDDPGAQDTLAYYQILLAQGADGIIAGRPNEMAATNS